MMEVINEIISMASKISGIEESRLSRESRISSDLRIDGDDVEELIHKIDIKYSLNFDGFSFNRYFSSESEIRPLKSLLLFLGVLSKQKASYEVTLGDIEEWILAGKWKERPE